MIHLKPERKRALPLDRRLYRIRYLVEVCFHELKRFRAIGTRYDKTKTSFLARNIAEGAGRWSEADSANRYKIARGEAMECAACLDVMKLRKVITDAQYTRGGQLLEGVVAMLTKML